MSNKGVKNAYAYICYFEIDQGCKLVLVVDITDIGIRWRSVWSYILMFVIKKPPIGRFFYFLLLRNKPFKYDNTFMRSAPQASGLLRFGFGVCFSRFANANLS